MYDIVFYMFFLTVPRANYEIQTNYYYMWHEELRGQRHILLISCLVLTMPGRLRSYQWALLVFIQVFSECLLFFYFQIDSYPGTNTVLHVFYNYLTELVSLSSPWVTSSSQPEDMIFTFKSIHHLWTGTPVQILCDMIFTIHRHCSICYFLLNTVFHMCEKIIKASNKHISTMKNDRNLN